MFGVSKVMIKKRLLKNLSMKEGKKKLAFEELLFSKKTGWSSLEEAGV